MSVFFLNKRTGKKPTLRGVVTGIVDNAFWYVYLAMIFCLSFIGGNSYSYRWLFFILFLSAYCSLYYCFSFINPKLTFLALRKAWLPVLLFFLMLLWLALQLLLPVESNFNHYLFGTSSDTYWLDLSPSWSVTPQATALLLFYNVMVFLLFTVTLSLINTRQRVKELIYLVFLVGLIHILLGVWAKYGNFHLVDKASLDGHFDAARGLFINRNHFAAFISLCSVSVIALLLKMLMNRSNIKLAGYLFYLNAITSLLGFFLVLVGLYVSESRGAFLAFILMLSVYLLFLLDKLKFNQGHPSMSRRYIVLFLLLAISLLGVMFGEGILARLTSDALSLGERKTQWFITLQAIKQQFWLGYGGGSYALVFQTFRDYADLRLVIYDQAHNDYLHIFLEQGAIGLLLWCGFISSVGTMLVRQYLRTKSSLTASVLLSGLIVLSAVLLQSLVDYPLQILTIRCYFFIIIALALSTPFVTYKSSK